MVQLTLAPVRNENLFTKHYLEERVRNFPEWEEEEIEEAFENIKEIYEGRKNRIKTYTDREGMLEEDFIRPVLKVLGHVYYVRPTIEETAEIPDYGFFESEEDLEKAIKNKEEGSQGFYDNSIAVGDAKGWNKNLDKKIEGKPVFENKNPSFQVDHYLRTTRPSWGILTNGRKWRLYFEEVNHPIGTYYEVDLVDILKSNDLEKFKYFYLFFRRQAFIPIGDSFLDYVYEGSEKYSRKIGEDLEENVYQALLWMAKGYFAVGTNNLEKTRENVEMVHDNSLIFLYRLLFLLYADSKELLPSKKNVHRRYYDLTISHWIEEFLEKKDNDALVPTNTKYYFQLSRIFKLIREGSEGMGISKDDFPVPAYNGELFNNKKHLDNEEEPFFDKYQIQDRYLAKVVDLLTRVKSEEREGKARVDYSDLSLRHLGGIYEGLLEYKLELSEKNKVAVKEEGTLKWVPASETEKDFKEFSEDKRVEEGKLYLTTDSRERKATGSYYTPDYIVNYIVKNTVGPVIENKLEDAETEEEKRQAILSTNVLDPAMGSGHFLVEATNFLAERLAEFAENGEEERGYDWAKRKVARNCIYGVDINPLATELAKVSLWLNTMAEDKPLSFLDHHLKTGNSLIGANLHELNHHPEEEKYDRSGMYDKSFQDNIKDLLDILRNIRDVTEETPEDIKEQEQLLKEFESHPFKKKFDVLADVQTSYYFGNEFPEKDYHKLLDDFRFEDLDDIVWEKLSQQDWVRKATNSIPDKKENNLSDEKKFFHWKLEFPEVFFDIGEGTEKDNPGFGAIIGNPPWISIKGKEKSGEWSENEIKYLIDKFEGDSYRPNMMEFFVRRALNLTAVRRRHSYIVPDRLAENKQFSDLRKEILGLRLESLVFRLDFPNIIADTLIYVLEKDNPIDKIKLYDESSLRRGLNPISVPIELFRENKQNAFFLIESENQRGILLNLLEDFNKLDSFCKTNTGFIAAKNKLKEDKSTKTMKKAIKGEDITRYAVVSSHYFDPKPENMIGGTQDINILKKTPQIFVRKTGSRIIAASSKDDYLPEQSVYQLWNYKEHGNKLLSCLNSKVIELLYTKLLVTNRESTPQLKKMDLDRVPIPNNENGKLDNLCGKISSLITSRRKINLNIQDYFGNYSEGQTIGELYTPALGVANTILTDTRDDKDSLKLGQVEFEEKNRELILKASAKYKPEDEEDFDDLDRWGYTETDLILAMKFTGSEEELALIREFTKLAVDEAGGFANFRKKATKTKSLIDRLEKLTLPKLEDVESGLEKYLEQEEKAERLEEEIQETDNLIDAIVFDLYDLNEEEVITVLDSLDTEEEIKHDILEKFRELKE